mmetsp:Transcript_24414/g.56882  ORF Transcript_24414/g.56882 Transcript_24414/m.56882 type:complete len:109 (-) Transcript_24414:765-1091(-)
MRNGVPRPTQRRHRKNEQLGLSPPARDSVVWSVFFRSAVPKLNFPTMAEATTRRWLFVRGRPKSCQETRSTRPKGRVAGMAVVACCVFIGAGHDGLLTRQIARTEDGG